MTEFAYHTYKNNFTVQNKVGRLLWMLYSAVFFRTLPTKYLNFIRVAGLRLFGAKIGRCGVSVHRTARIWAPWNLTMDSYTLIDRDCRIYNPAMITIRSETVISENVYLCTASHDIRSRQHELITRPIVLEGKNWVAASAILLPGVTIGEGAVVGAGAVVPKSVAPWKVVAGNPAREVADRIFHEGVKENE